MARDAYFNNPTKPALRSSNPPPTITTPPLAFQNSPAPTNPSAPTPPPNRTIQIPAPTSPPPPPPSINSRHAREGRLATPHSHMHLTLTLGFLGRTGRCCFYRSKTTSSQFLRSGRLRSTLHRLVRIIRFDSARSWFIATSLSTIRLPSSSTPSALFLP